MPKEHGSWSLALEPLVLGLLAAPSIAGLWIALAALTGFLLRRPLRLAWRDSDPLRRRLAGQILFLGTMFAAIAFGLGVAAAARSVLPWMLLPAAAGAVFAYYDLQNSGREAAAEIAGAAAFAALTGMIAAAGGWPTAAAAALLCAMAARAVPTVMLVRAYLRAAKTGRSRVAPALSVSSVALAVAVLIWWLGQLPAAVVVALGLFWARAFALLVFPRPALRARTLGLVELALGAAYVIGLGLTWSV